MGINVIFSILIVSVFVLNTAELTSGKLVRVYEANPFLNGEFQPGILLPQQPVNDPSEHDQNESHPIIDPIRVNYRPTLKPTTEPLPIIPIGPILPPGIHPIPPHPPIPPVVHPTNDPYKYCLEPRGTFQSRYCNAFVNCWDGNAVEQFCGATLVFNPKGYCDYAWNVNCHGKPIKELPVVPGGNNGWPSDGSYVPPVIPTHPPVHPKPPPIGPAKPEDGIFTIEPPGFGNPVQDPSLPPIYRPPLVHTRPPTHPPTHATSHLPTLPPIHHPTQPPTHPPSGNDELRKYCLHPRGQFAGPDCHKFINCWDDVVIEQDCPFGLHFNPNKHYCDFPHNYPCRIIKGVDDLHSKLTHDYPDNQLGF